MDARWTTNPSIGTNGTMNKAFKVNDLPDFNPAKHLRDKEDIAAYLSVILEEGEAADLAKALGCRLTVVAA